MWGGIMIAHHAKHNEWGDLAEAFHRLLTQDGRVAIK